MQFKHPEILYALFLLLIPIIVHLFQLRKFKKVEFTNVAFLKEATLQTRKSSQIKKWLILFTRLLLLAAIIFAFSQPFTSKLNNVNEQRETIIYLDNSFSMQAKGEKGELLKRAIQDLISSVPEDEEITLMTNDETYKKTSIKAIKNDLLQMGYSATNLPMDAVFLKINSGHKSNNKNLRNIVIISDFQEDESDLITNIDSISRVNLVQLKPVNSSNIAIDSAYISNSSASNLELTVKLKNNGSSIENLPISLYNNEQLIAKTSISLDITAETIFSIPINTQIDGKIIIDDGSLQFDNTLYFNINKAERINVLSVNDADDSYLKRIYTADEFNLNSTRPNQLNYNSISDQKLIILNELNQIPNALSSSLKSFILDGGSVLVIPSNTSNTNSYNSLLNQFEINFEELIESEKRITTINYAHPIYDKGVFEKQVDNFQYPKVNSYYSMNTGTASSVLKFENGNAFLGQKSNLFVFSAPINKTNSNFQNSPLIVPTMYNIGKFSLKIPDLYFTIGKQNKFDVPVRLQQDDILNLQSGDLSIIPMQQQYNSKVVVNTMESPSIAGIYSVLNDDEQLMNVSYNYDRKESDLSYRNISNIENVTLSNSIESTFDTLKSDSKINALWKWFVIFALLLLITEMLILKYFK